MFRRCVGSQVHRLLVCPRLSPSAPALSSAWQRYRSDGSFMAGVPRNRPSLATFHFDPPMACDILNSDLTRTGPSARIRQVRQRVSLVMPSRGIRIRTSSRLRDVCQANGKDRTYHNDTNRGKVDICVQDNRRRKPRSKHPNQTSQRLRKLMEYDVSDTGGLGTKPARHHIRVKVKRKKPLKARQRRDTPKPLPSSVNSEEAEEFFDCQEPRSPINKFITLIWEKSKEVRAQLLEGKYADLKRINSKNSKDEDQIWHYKNLYEEQIQKKTRGLGSRSVDAKEFPNPPKATLSQEMPLSLQDANQMAQGNDVVLGNFSTAEQGSEELTNSALAPPPKAPPSKDQSSEDSTPKVEEKEAFGLSEEVSASSNANLSKAEKACEELGKSALASAPSPPSLNDLKSREESLMSNAKKESIHRWQVHKRSQPFEAMSHQFPKLKQMHLDAVSQYAIRKQSQNHNQPDVNAKSQPVFLFPPGQDSKKSKAKKNHTDHRIYKSAVREEIQSQLKEFNSSKCKSNTEIIDEKSDLKDKKLSEHEETLKQLKEDIHKQIWNYFDHDSRTLNGETDMDFSTFVGKLNDKDELKFRVAEMLAKCMFLVQNKMENESGGGIAYEEKDKDVAKIAEDIWKHHVQNREYQACKQELGELQGENESMGKCEEIEETKEAGKLEEEEIDLELCQKSEEARPKSGDGMKSELSSWNSKDHELCVMDQIEKVMGQCQRLKNQIEKRSSKSGQHQPKPDEELNQKCMESDFQSKEVEEELKKKCDESVMKGKCSDEVQESKSDKEVLQNRNLETGLSHYCAEDPRGIMDIIIEALKEKCKNNDTKNKCTQTEEEVPEEKCPEEKQEMACAGTKLEQGCEEYQMEEYEESQKIECPEGELENKCKDKELEKKCTEGDPEERCATDEEKRKEAGEECATDEEKRKQGEEECASLASEINCAENDIKTKKKYITDDEDESEKCQEEESEDLYELSPEKIKNKCEEMELEKGCPEELAKCNNLENKLKEKLQTMKDNIRTKEIDKSVAFELKNFCEKIDRQKRAADEKLKKMRKQMEGCPSQCKDEFSELTWPEGLRVETSMDETKVFPGLNGIFRLPGFAKRCLEEPLCDPVPSVWPKLNGRDYRELSLKQRQSFLYPGSTFPNNLNPRRVPLLESNFFLRRLWPDLKPLSINNSLRGYWLRRTPVSYLPFCRRSYATKEYGKF